jgi:hypothetical protein
MKKSPCRPVCEAGLKIKTKLLQLCKTQNWLIVKMKEETGLFVDSSLLYKVLTGQNTNPKLLRAIEKILDIAL